MVGTFISGIANREVNIPVMNYITVMGIRSVFGWYTIHDSEESITILPNT